MQTGLVTDLRALFSRTANAIPALEAHIQGDSTHTRVKHTAYQTLMQHAQCRLSEPLSAAVRVNHGCCSRRAFLQVHGRRLIRLLLASRGPSPLTKTDSQWISVRCSSKIKSFWEGKGSRSERKFITRQLELCSSWT